MFTDSEFQTEAPNHPRFRVPSGSLLENLKPPEQSDVYKIKTRWDIKILLVAGVSFYSAVQLIGISNRRRFFQSLEFSYLFRKRNNKNSAVFSQLISNKTGRLETCDLNFRSAERQNRMELSHGYLIRLRFYGLRKVEGHTGDDPQNDHRA